MARGPIGVSGHHLRTLFALGAVSGLTDEQLLERFTTERGDAAELAFAAIVERHGTLVFRTCHGILRDHHEAMDAFQATFLILAQKGGSLRVRETLGPWLHRVACRAAGHARRSANRRRRLELRMAQAAKRQTIEREPDDLAIILHQELDRLPERYRIPIVLCDLEGLTCEQAARQMGCPVGTIGSRLARGRERLRDRLRKRGVATTGGTLAALLAAETQSATVPAALMAETIKAVAGQPSVAVATLARTLFWSMIMAKYKATTVAALTICGVSLAAAWELRPLPVAQAQPPKAAAAAKPVDPFPYMNDSERKKGYIMATIGNMRPLINDESGVRFQSREAIAYKDGTAKLWSQELKGPVAPTLRQDGPIMELTFFDEANLLVTRSAQSIKLWDALTGASRKTLENQTMNPLWLSFAAASKRFVTVDLEGKSITVWDATTLEPVAKLTTKQLVSRSSVGLSGDGQTVVTFAADQTIELWDVTTGESFATLRRPSSIVAEVFRDGDKGFNKFLLLPYVSAREGRFWELVRSLAPAAKAGNGK